MRIAFAARKAVPAGLTVCLLFACLTGPLSVALAPSHAVAAGSEGRTKAQAIEALVYDYAVLEHCGLLNDGFAQLFAAHLKKLTDEAGLSKDAARKARLRGWVAADREYDNRGLGGHRAWCREDGGTAKARFEDLEREDP